MMKKMFFGLLLGTGLLAQTACTKSNNPDDGLSDASATRISSVLNDGDFSSRIQKYGMLLPAERHQLWKDHWLKAKAQFTAAGETAKVSLVDRLLNDLKLSVFEDIGGSTADVYFTYTMPVWQQDARQVMSDQEIYDLGFNPSAEVIGRAVPSVEESGGPQCFCHVGMSGFTCRRVQVGFPSGITVTNGICERTAAYCEGSSLGCGWVWFQSCYGNHCNF